MRPLLPANALAISLGNRMNYICRQNGFMLSPQPVKSASLPEGGDENSPGWSASGIRGKCAN
jgi:hypothetical protein